MAAKTYVLLEHMKPAAPIYYRVSRDKRMKIENIPQYSPYLRQTIYDADGKAKTVRFKLSSNTIDQSEQIKNDIPANSRFTTAERDAVKFRNGMKMTLKENVQKYLESIPEFEGYTGQREPGQVAVYKILDKQAEIVSDNKNFKRNLKAANLIDGLELEKANEMLLRIYGTHHQLPKTIEEAQNQLVDYMDTGDEAVSMILKDTITFDEEVTVTLGKLIDANLLSFNQEPDAVSIFRNGVWVSVKQISSTAFNLEERRRMFMDFLGTTPGVQLLTDLEEMAEKIVKEPVKEEPKKTKATATAT